MNLVNIINDEKYVWTDMYTRHWIYKLNTQLVT